MGSCRLVSKGDGASLVLQGEFLVEHAAMFLEEMAGALERFGEVELDITDLSGADVSFYQLVVSATASAERNGRKLTLSGSRPAFLDEQIKRFGLEFVCRGCLLETREESGV